MSLTSKTSVESKLSRLKKYGLKDKSPTVSSETVVVEKKDKLECCKVALSQLKGFRFVTSIVVCNASGLASNPLMSDLYEGSRR